MRVVCKSKQAISGQPLVGAPIPDVNNVATHPTLHFTPYEFLFLSWMTPLLRLGSKRPLVESVVIHIRFWLSCTSHCDIIHVFLLPVGPAPSKTERRGNLSGALGGAFLDSIASMVFRQETQEP